MDRTRLQSGVGIGFRRGLADQILCLEKSPLTFLEIAPENWMGIGGHWGRRIREAAEKFPFNCHGLSLSLGSPEELDWDFLKRLKAFFKEFPVQIYSEHLSYTKCDNAHTYELLPLPFRKDAVLHLARRIREAQDFLERRIAIENVSYYTSVAAQMSEAEFISEIVERADCDLLLDVNNVYVNAFNHKYEAKQFLRSLPLEKVVYIHMAGHEQVSPDLIIDTHGQAIIDPVFELFAWTLEQIEPVPVLLERDFNYPQFSELLGELGRLDQILKAAWRDKAHAA